MKLVLNTSDIVVFYKNKINFKFKRQYNKYGMINDLILMSLQSESKENQRFVQLNIYTQRGSIKM